MSANFIKVDDFTVDGECSRCGNCCSDLLPLTDAELKNIKDYVRINDIKNNRPNCLSDDAVLLTCPFYNMDEKKCDIYEIRPSICRVFKCNQSLSEIRKNKKENFNNIQRSPVSLRDEIFGENNMPKLIALLQRM